MGTRYATSLEESMLPSQCQEHWLQFWRPGGERYNPRYVGKWMVFTADVDRHDTQWPLLKQALATGSLGVSMKASTPLSTRAEALTCLYTRDFRERDDVKRVLSSLRTLGYRQALYYKADAQTRAKSRGSLYYSLPGSQELHVSQAGKFFLASYMPESESTE